AARLAKVFVNSKSAVAAAEAGKQGIASAEKAMQQAQGSPVDAREAHGVWVAQKVGNHANEGRAAHATWAEGELTGQLSAAVGRVLSTAAAEIRAPQGGNEGAAPEGKEEDDAP